jgi:hypothetical protein
MKSKFKVIPTIGFVLLIAACQNKTKIAVEKNIPKTNTTLATTIKAEESIEGTYKTTECDISVEITKEDGGYRYFLKTNDRKVKGKASFSTDESGGKYLVFEGIKWDEYEGDISNEEETDYISDSKPQPELEVPVGIGASYVKDTLTIQNYGNAMNSYTKISECGEKYIQLIKHKK